MVKRSKPRKFIANLDYLCPESGVKLKDMMFISPTIYNTITSYYVRSLTLGDDNIKIIMFKSNNDIIMYSEKYDTFK